MKKVKDYTNTNPSLTKTVVCYFIQKNKVLLGLRKKTQWGLGLHLITGIGGKVGDLEQFIHETNEEALIREVKEEIDVDVLSFHAVGQVTFLFPYKPKCNQEVCIYILLIPGKGFQKKQML